MRQARVRNALLRCRAACNWELSILSLLDAYWTMREHYLWTISVVIFAKLEQLGLILWLLLKKNDKEDAL